MNTHVLRLMSDEETTCIKCGAVWTYFRPLGQRCTPMDLCFDDGEGRWRPHFYLDDGHCGNCGKVDR